MSLDRDQIQKRFDRITEIFSGIVDHAGTTSLVRCPYRNADDLCTALFKCRNQEVDEGRRDSERSFDSPQELSLMGLS